MIKTEFLGYNSPMKYEWLLFDADGTLFDFDKAEAEALSGAFAAFDLPYNSHISDSYHKVNSQIWLEFEQGLITQQELRSQRFARLFKILDLEVDATAFSDVYINHLGRGTYLIEGAEVLLEALNGRFHLLLITNGIADVQRPRLAGSTIKQYFPIVIISGEIGTAKPDPKIFDAAFEAMDHPAKEKCLIIGDSLSSDIRGGLNYGIDTCWYNSNGNTAVPAIKATYEIHDLAQLPEILL